MQTYFVQVILGHLFEDLYIKARTPQDAVAKARKVVAKDHPALAHRFTNYVLG